MIGIWKVRRSVDQPKVRPKGFSLHSIVLKEIKNKWNRKIGKKEKKLFCRYFPELKECL